MKASVTIDSDNTPTDTDILAHRFEGVYDKGSKVEPFYIAAIGSDRRSVDRATQRDQRR